MCQLWGYEAEEHIVQTKDGYLLGLHRLQWRRGEEGQRVNCGRNSAKKRVAYLHHGLLMNSEVWVCLTDEQRCLPFELVERGFDVWVSRYSCPVCFVTAIVFANDNDPSSLETTVATNTPRNPFTARPPRSNSGTFPLMNLLSTIFQTASSTSSKRPDRKAFRTLAFRKELLKHSQPWPSIPS